MKCICVCSAHSILSSSLQWKWSVPERPLHVPQWLEGAGVWRSHQPVHRRDLQRTWDVYSGDLHLQSRLQRRELRGRYKHSDSQWELKISFLSCAKNTCKKTRFIVGPSWKRISVVNCCRRYHLVWCHSLVSSWKNSPPYSTQREAYLIAATCRSTHKCFSLSASQMQHLLSVKHTAII